MTDTKLKIIDWGLFLPPVFNAKDVILNAGGDPTRYLKGGWEKICIANEEDYPSSMCTLALDTCLKRNKITADQLKLIISVSESQDFPETSVAIEVMEQLKIPGSCLAFDLYQSCTAPMTAMSLAKSWLNDNGGGFAAIISAEKWSRTVDKTDPEIEICWGYADGASALLVGSQTEYRSKLIIHNSSFRIKPNHNGFTSPIFGGARFPLHGERESSIKRRAPHIKTDEMFNSYVENLGLILNSLNQKMNMKPNWLVCTQVGPGVLEALGYLLEIESELIVSTGKFYGHMGSSDIALGLDELSKSGRMKGAGIIAGCAANGWSLSYAEAI